MSEGMAWGRERSDVEVAVLAALTSIPCRLGRSQHLQQLITPGLLFGGSAQSLLLLRGHCMPKTWKKSAKRLRHADKGSENGVLNLLCNVWWSRLQIEISSFHSSHHFLSFQNLVHSNILALLTTSHSMKPRSIAFVHDTLRPTSFGTYVSHIHDSSLNLIPIDLEMVLSSLLPT
jgi:hypothetical protein